VSRAARFAHYRCGPTGPTSSPWLLIELSSRPLRPTASITRFGQRRRNAHAEPSLACPPGALIVGVAASACAALPTSGSVKLSTLQAFGAARPSTAWRSWQWRLVLGGVPLISLAAPARRSAAQAFDGHRHAIAREYLTPRFTGCGRPGWAATHHRLSEGRHSGYAAKNQFSKPAGDPPPLVNLTGTHFATLQTAGQRPGRQRGGVTGSSEYQFSLVPPEIAVAGALMRSITTRCRSSPASCY